MKAAGLAKSNYQTQIELIQMIAKHIATIDEGLKSLAIEAKNANSLKNTQKRAMAYCNKVKPIFDTIRKASDSLEFFIDDELWKLPKYREMLFLK